MRNAAVVSGLLMLAITGWWTFRYFQRRYRRR